MWAGLNHRRYGPVRRLCVATGNSPPTRSEAIEIVAEVRGAILKGKFDPAGKVVRIAPGERTFSDLLDDFVKDYVERAS
jgi:hypothetical protein